MISRLMISLKETQTLLARVAQEQDTMLRAVRHGAHFRSGALKPKPDELPFGLVGVVCAVVPGLFIGAAISKSVANFLEENDLFVPSDDDDDED